MVSFGGHANGRSLSTSRERAVRAPLPECLNRTRKRKSVKPAFCWLPSFPSTFPCRESRPPAGKPALETHDVADNFGDRMIMFHRDLLVDLDGGMQRPRQRHVLDDGDIVLAGDFPDLARDRIDALRSEERRVGKEWRSRWSPY